MGTQYWVNNVVGNDANLGTSEGAGNAWASIGKFMQTNVGDDRCAVQYTGTNYTAQDGATNAIGSIITAGASNAPTVIEGYTNTLGDGTWGLIVLDAGVNALANCINSALGSVNLFYTFRYFRFTGASANGVDLTPEDGCMWVRCRFDNNGADGIVGDNEHRFALCQFDNNSSDGADTDTVALHFGSVAFSNTSIGLHVTEKSTLYGCVSYENGNDQLSIREKCSVLNCTFDGNNSARIGIGSAAYLSIIANTILYDCSTGIDGSPGGEDLCVSLHNLYNSNTQDVNSWPTDSSDIFGDPLFVDPAANNYMLQTGSPARQAAAGVVSFTGYGDVGAHQARDSNLIATSGADFEAVLRAYLAAQTTLTDETGQRIYVDDLPEGFEISKALLLREASGVDQPLVTATDSFIEFECYGANKIDAKAVYIALHAVFRAIPSGGITMSGKKVWWNEKTFGPSRFDDEDTDWPSMRVEYVFRVKE